MKHCQLADLYHLKGYNCSQSVLAAFSDLTGLDEQTSLSVAGSFGRGAGSGELCGAICGALMVLGMQTPVDTSDPAGSKLRAVARGREFLQRFAQRFGSVRCETLLPKPLSQEDLPPSAQGLGITDHCSILAAAAAELVEEMLREQAGTGQPSPASEPSA